MTTPTPADGILPPQVRRHLHDASGQLSLAMLQLGLSLEEPALDPVLRESLGEALDACHGAAASLREIWRLVAAQPSAGTPKA